MTREDFAKGWLLLMAQPWGRRYAEDTDIARVQSEFYFSRFSHVPQALWRQACERMASGDSWPSVDDLMGTMTAMLPSASQHLGVESAWAAVSSGLRDERISIVWTDEMREAFFVARPLADDPVQARMAFKESYGALINRAISQGQTPKWSVSLGDNKDGRADAVRDAVARGRITQEQGVKLLPYDVTMTEAEQSLLQLLGDTKRIGG